MKTLTHVVVAALLVGTAIVHLRAEEPETVVIRLNPKPGATADLEKVIAKHWETAKRLNLVADTPHLTMRGLEGDNQDFLLEVLTWRDADIPDHAPAEIQAIWAEMSRLVEKRGQRPGLAIDQVSLVTP
jgi:hypothetical protein